MSSVWYIGEASSRSIESSDWASVGIPNKDRNEWDQGNGYSLPQNIFAAEQLAVLDLDDGFVLTDQDGPRPGATVTPPNDVAKQGWVIERIHEDRAALLEDLGDGDGSGGGTPTNPGVLIDGGTP